MHSNLIRREEDLHSSRDRPIVSGRKKILDKRDEIDGTPYPTDHRSPAKILRIREGRVNLVNQAKRKVMDIARPSVMDLNGSQGTLQPQWDQ